MLVAATVPPEGPWWLAWPVEPLTLGSLLAAASIYAAGLVRVRRHGAAVRFPSIVAWYAGLAVLAIALASPIDAYADVSFAVHMTQHLLLMVVAPPLLALGTPIGVALRALRPTGARRLSAALRSRPIVVATVPVVAWTLFVVTPWAVHLSPVFDLALRSTAWHGVEHSLWVAAALVFWWPVVGADPTPHPWSYPTRMLALFLAMPAVSFLALVLFSAEAPLYPAYAGAPDPWGLEALASQRDAAVQMWLIGNLVTVAAMLLVAAAWKRHDDERQRRLEARIDAASVA